jgi:hypothetical protein
MRVEITVLSVVIRGRCGNAAIAARLFFYECAAFFKNGWHFKDIFRELEAFLNISNLFEDIFREIEVFFN